MRRSALLAFAIAVLGTLLVAAAGATLRLGRALTTSAEYIAELQRRGVVDWLPPGAAWKIALAGGARCAGARVVVLGSSRLVEVDGDVLGVAGRVCNLAAPGMAPAALEAVARVLPDSTETGERFAYVGLDHFTFYPSLGVDPLQPAPEGWLSKPIQLTRALTSLSVERLLADLDDLRLARDRGRQLFDRYALLVYRDGHLFRPFYYAMKAEGRAHPITDKDLRAAITLTVPRDAAVDPERVATFERALRTLVAKGYRLRVFWNPLVPNYLALAERHNPTVLRQSVLYVEHVLKTVAVDRYAGAQVDASSFGCTERDYRDAIHVDIDCLNRFFTTRFGANGPREAATLSRVLLKRHRREYLSRLAQSDMPVAVLPAAEPVPVTESAGARARNELEHSWRAACPSTN